MKNTDRLLINRFPRFITLVGLTAPLLLLITCTVSTEQTGSDEINKGEVLYFAESKDEIIAAANHFYGYPIFSKHMIDMPIGNHQFFMIAGNSGFGAPHLNIHVYHSTKEKQHWKLLMTTHTIWVQEFKASYEADSRQIKLLSEKDRALMIIPLSSVEEDHIDE